ncbi:MAG: hypothetical protein WA655_01985 [Candidatus Korobacteraceae bacterium]
MNRGFYLTLMMGGFNASPVPEPVIEALTEVTVSSTVGAQAGFQLKFTLGKTSAVSRLMASGFFDPRQRVIIAVTVNGSTEVLMDGIITRQEVTPSNSPGKGTLTVTGLDLTALMDFIDLTGIPYPAIPFFLAVDLILAKYLVLGVVPVVIPPILTLFENPIEKFRKQQGTDYHFVNLMAAAVGAVFYLDPGPKPGMSLAYWGPDISKLFGTTQPALSINLDASTNLESINFSYDGTLATQFFITVIEPITKVPIPIPVPSIDLLKAPMAAHAPTALKSKQIKPAASENIVEAALHALASEFVTADVISATGSLDVLRYGHVFKAREVAAVRGAGDYYDGKYYVKSVTHNIKRGEYKQNFTLSRGGVGSSVSTVSV